MTVKKDGITEVDSSGGGGGNVTIVGPLGQQPSASSVPVVIASDQSPVPVTSTPIANTLFSFTFSGGADPTFAIPSGIATLSAVWAPPGAIGGFVLQVSNDNGTTYKSIYSQNEQFGFVLPYGASPAEFSITNDTLSVWNIAGFDHIKLAAVGGLANGTVKCQFSAAQAPGRWTWASLVSAYDGSQRVAVNNSKSALLVDDVGSFAETSKNSLANIDTNTTSFRTSTNTLNGLNVAVTLSVSGGLHSVGISFPAGTLNGTLTPFYSIDGGTTWFPAQFLNSASILSSLVLTNPNPASAYGIILADTGVTNVKVQTTAFTSGNVTITLTAERGDASDFGLDTEYLRQIVNSLLATISTNIASLGGETIPNDAVVSNHLMPVGGMFADAGFSIGLSEGDFGLLRLTEFHGLHTTPYDENGNRLATNANPIFATEPVTSQTFSLNSVNTQEIALNGANVLLVQVTTIPVATVTVEVEADGVNWAAVPLLLITGAASTFLAANPSPGLYAVNVSGCVRARIKVTAYISGTLTGLMITGHGNIPQFYSQSVTQGTSPWVSELKDSTTGQTATIKPASVAPVATDKALVVAVSPNTPTLPVSIAATISASVTSLPVVGANVADEGSPSYLSTATNQPVTQTKSGELQIANMSELIGAIERLTAEVNDLRLVMQFAHGIDLH